MSKMLEIESCWVYPRFKDLTCLLHREVQQPDKKITDNIHPDCPLSDKEDFVKSLDIGDLCDGVIYHLKNDKEKSDE